MSEQYAAKVADLALGVRSGGRLGHQPQELHLHVSLRGCLHVILPSNRSHYMLLQKKHRKKIHMAARVDIYIGFTCNPRGFTSFSRDICDHIF